MSAFLFRLSAAISGLSSGALVVALIAQHQFSMAPCSWCIIQRLILLALVLIGTVSMVAVKTVTGARWVSIAGMAVSGLGAASAYYQATVAVNSVSCDQSLADKILSFMGLDALLPEVFAVYASCMQAKIAVYGLDAGWWALGLFGVLGLMFSVPLWRNPGR